MALPAGETMPWLLGLLLGLLLAGVPDTSDGQQPPVPGDIRISALFDSENDQPAIEAAFNHACNMVNDDRSTLIRSTLSCSAHQITPADSFKASKISKIYPPPFHEPAYVQWVLIHKISYSMRILKLFLLENH